MCWKLNFWGKRVKAPAWESSWRTSECVSVFRGAPVAPGGAWFLPFPTDQTRDSEQACLDRWAKPNVVFFTFYPTNHNQFIIIGREVHRAPIMPCIYVGRPIGSNQTASLEQGYWCTSNDAEVKRKIVQYDIIFCSFSGYILYLDIDIIYCSEKLHGNVFFRNAPPYKRERKHSQSLANKLNEEEESKITVPTAKPKSGKAKEGPDAKRIRFKARNAFLSRMINGKHSYSLTRVHYTMMAS